MSKCKELRAKARESLGHNIFGGKWLYPLLALLVLGLIEGALGFTAIGTLIVIGPLSYGCAKSFLKVARGEEEKVDIGRAIGDGFSDDAGRNIISGILVTVFEFLWSLLFVIPGIVKSYSYSMTFYILQDRPELSANDAITESRKLMKGHKGKLFKLDLSFIGWYLLGLLCLGFGVLWVDPYHEMARAHFYQELKLENSKVIETEVKEAK